MEESSPDNSRALINDAFGPAILETAVVDRLEEVREDINAAIQRIEQLMQYVAGLYTDDRQRQLAEKEVFRLKQLVQRYATEALPGALDLPTNLYSKVTVNT